MLRGRSGQATHAGLRAPEISLFFLKRVLRFGWNDCAQLSCQRPLNRGQSLIAGDFANGGKLPAMGAKAREKLTGGKANICSVPNKEMAPVVENDELGVRDLSGRVGGGRVRIEQVVSSG